MGLAQALRPWDGTRWETKQSLCTSTTDAAAARRVNVLNRENHLPVDASEAITKGDMINLTADAENHLFDWERTQKWIHPENGGTMIDTSIGDGSNTRYG